MFGELVRALITFGLIISLMIAGLYLLFYVMRCFLVVVQGTAAGADSFPWPEETIIDWVGQSVGLVGLVLIWLIPVGITSQILRDTWLVDDPATRVLLMALPVLWIFFPVGALSSLSSLSPWVFFRPVIASRMLRMFPSLLFFYLSTGLVGLLGVGSFYQATIGGKPQLLLLAVPLCATMVLVYARLLGRLGWMIRQFGPLPVTKARKRATKKKPQQLRKKIKVKDPWSAPVEEPEPPPPKRELKPWQNVGDDIPYELADSKKPPRQEEEKRPPKRIRPLDEEELDALKGFGVAEPLPPPLEKREPEELAPAYRARPLPRKPEPKIAWPLLKGVYDFPWYASNLSAWTYLLFGFLVVGLLLIGLLNYLPKTQ
jgi:hypothetical protein